MAELEIACAKKPLNRGRLSPPAVSKERWDKWDEILRQENDAKGSSFPRQLLSHHLYQQDICRGLFEPIDEDISV